jgi:hypothetical protein
MELWRYVGAGIVGLGGLALMLVAVAQTRDSAALRTRRGGRGPVGPAPVLRTAVLGLAITAVAVVGVLTVLPSLVVWTAAALVWLVLGVLILAD